MDKNYTKIERELPLVPLRGLAIFPYMILSFDVGREKSLKAIDEAMADDEMIFLTAQKDSAIDMPTQDDYYHTGTICKIKQLVKLPGEGVRVLVEGISRGVITEFNQDEPCIRVSVEEVVYDIESINDDKEVQATVRNVFDAFEEYINISNRVSPEILINLAEMDNEDRFVDTIAANMFLGREYKKNGLIDYKRMRKEAQEIIDEFDLPLHADTLIRDLSIGMQQIVEILKAVR